MTMNDARCNFLTIIMVTIVTIITIVIISMIDVIAVSVIVIIMIMIGQKPKAAGEAQVFVETDPDHVRPLLFLCSSC